MKASLLDYSVRCWTCDQKSKLQMKNRHGKILSRRVFKEGTPNILKFPKWLSHVGIDCGGEVAVLLNSLAISVEIL